MAGKVCHFALIVALLTSARVGVGAPSWEDDLSRNLNAMARNIEEQVHSATHNLQERLNLQIQNSLRPALAQVHRAVENIPRDAQGRIITNGRVITSNGGNIVSINSVNGVSKIVTSGHRPDGEPYVNVIEERNDGDYLYHDETSHNPRTNATERIRWKLDLKTPGAKPEFLPTDGQ